MTSPLPEQANIDQLRTQAKELLKSLREGHLAELNLDEALDPNLSPERVRLADAQRILARRYGFPSWPALVAHIERPRLVEQIKACVERGDAEGLASLFKSEPRARKYVNEESFSFNSPPLVVAGHAPRAQEIISILIKNGADPNQRSTWWAGGFSPLDAARGNDKVADLLVSLGARWDIWSASTHGRLDVVRQLLDEDPSRVNAPGGDGQRPLHTAATAEVARLLIERGADLYVRDVDHESTPAMYQIENLEVLRVIAEAGGGRDVFVAVALDDVALLESLLTDDPNAGKSRVGEPPYTTTTSSGGHIYLYSVGEETTPFLYAARQRRTQTYALLEAMSSPVDQVIGAALWEDEELVRQKASKQVMSTEEARKSVAVAIACRDEQVGAVRCLLLAGFSPEAMGNGQASAAHVAAWRGRDDILELVAPRVDPGLLDPFYGGTPLAWAIHGSVHFGKPERNYARCVDLLLQAGADPYLTFQDGSDLLTATSGKPDIQEVILRHRQAKG